MKSHHYSLKLKWIGNTGQGTRTYGGYSRNHEITIEGKPVLPGSSDPLFRGDANRYNPEELLLAAISSCHMLWFLHLCSDHQIVVTRYEDHPEATMEEELSGSGQFTLAVLHPVVTISDGDAGRANGLHEQAHHLCYVARSLNFPVRCEGKVVHAG